MVKSNIELGSSPQLLILPSFSEFTSRVAEDVSLKDVEVVGSLSDSYSNAVDVLAVVASGKRPNVIVFSDQLVNSEDAPLPVIHHGKLTFFPAIEALLVSRYRYPAHIWTPNGFTELTQCTFQSVLEALSRYFDSCDLFGDQWQARNIQSRRAVHIRAQSVTEEIRRYQSCALFAYVRRGMAMDGCLKVTLEKTDATIKQLKVSQ